MAAPLKLKAIGASPGFASGPAFVAEPPSTVSEHAAFGSAELTAAVEAAIGELQDLSQGADPESGDIIDFQIEVLRDPTIADMATARTNAGENAVFAWVRTLDGYIRELEGADEEELRARAVDILDIKNRVLAALTGTPVRDFPAGSIYIGSDMEPSRFLAHDWSLGGGIALHNGSAAGHVALLARSRAVPMVIGAGPFTTASGQPVEVDGSDGLVILEAGHGSASSERIERATISVITPVADGGVLRTMDGADVRLSINLNAPDEINRISVSEVAGIGLMRSEFSVISLADAANEEKQVGIYRHALTWAEGKPVTIRMLDIGGDKPLAGLSAGEDRGLRLLLSRPEIARVQARALLRAGTFGNLRVMLPMVRFPSEVDEIREIFRQESAELTRRGVPNAMPPIGMMVEVPVAALTLDRFQTAEFFSFGTNDLGQYLVASTRDDGDFTARDATAIEAIMRLITQAAKLAGGKPLSICGDMAGDPQRAAELLAIGIRDFSMAPTQLPAIRSALVGLNADGTKAAGA